jgi:hypothetical protein
VDRFQATLRLTPDGVEGLAQAVRILNDFIAEREVNTEPNLHAFVGALSNAVIEPILVN